MKRSHNIFNLQLLHLFKFLRCRLGRIFLSWFSNILQRYKIKLCCVHSLLDWAKFDFFILSVNHIECIKRNFQKRKRVFTKLDNIKVSIFSFPQSFNFDIRFLIITNDFEVLSKMFQTLFFIKELFNPPNTTHLYQLRLFSFIFILCLIDFLLNVVQIRPLTLGSLVLLHLILFDLSDLLFLHLL